MMHTTAGAMTLSDLNLLCIPYMPYEELLPVPSSHPCSVASSTINWQCSQTFMRCHQCKSVLPGGTGSKQYLCMTSVCTLC